MLCVLCPEKYVLLSRLQLLPHILNSVVGNGPNIWCRVTLYPTMCAAAGCSMVGRFNAAAEKLTQDAARLESELEAAQVTLDRLKWLGRQHVLQRPPKTHGALWTVRTFVMPYTIALYFTSVGESRRLHTLSHLRFLHAAFNIMGPYYLT